MSQNPPKNTMIENEKLAIMKIKLKQQSEMEKMLEQEF